MADTDRTRRWTQGPWAVGKRGVDAVCHEEGFKIAICTMCGFMNQPSVAADAALIAAAPELYDALESCMTKFRAALLHHGACDEESVEWAIAEYRFLLERVRRVHGEGL